MAIAFNTGLINSSDGLMCVMKTYENNYQDWAAQYFNFGASGYTFTMSFLEMQSTWSEGVCFTEDTLVTTIDGHKQIKDIEVGDEVYSENTETGEKGLKQVVNVFVNDQDGKPPLFEYMQSLPYFFTNKGGKPFGCLIKQEKSRIYH